MLPLSHYPILLITLNYMQVASSARTFFLHITARRIFFRQVSLAGIFFGGELSPHLRLFLMVRLKQTIIQHLSYSECLIAF